MKLKSINTEQKLYIISYGDRFTCYGFDVLDRKARAVAQWSKVIPPLAEPGTLNHFEECARIMDYGTKYATETGTRCNAELTPQLIGLEGRRVEVVDCYGERRRFKVGKSTGWMPCHLELANSRSISGGPVTGAPFRSVRCI